MSDAIGPAEFWEFEQNLHRIGPNAARARLSGFPITYLPYETSRRLLGGAVRLISDGVGGAVEYPPIPVAIARYRTRI